jgi:lysophospholipase L1-like esterase
MKYLLLALLSLAAAANAAVVAPYQSVYAGPANFGPANGETSIDVLFTSHTNRIRQNGSASGGLLFLPSTNSLTGLYLKFWRRGIAGTETNYSLLGSTENLAGELTPGVTNTVSFRQAVGGLLEGDFYGFRAEFSGASTMNFYADTNASSIVLTNSAGSGASIISQTNPASPGSAPFQILMASPDLVFTGDSIMSGRVEHESYADYFFAVAPDDDPPSSTPFMAGGLLGMTYQNMAISGQVTEQIHARFISDVLAAHPRYAVIEGGANNCFGAGQPPQLAIQDFTDMVRLCQASNVVPVVVLIYPFHGATFAGYGTVAQCQLADTINSNLLTFSNQFPGTIVVDTRPWVGQYSPDGPPGNFWTLAAQYNSGDGIHPSAAGHARVALAIAEAINPTLPVLPPLLALSLDSAGEQLLFRGDPGRLNDLETSAQIGGPWTILTQAIATVGFGREAAVNLPPANDEVQFYRLRVE